MTATGRGRGRRVLYIGAPARFAYFLNGRVVYRLFALRAARAALAPLLLLARAMQCPHNRQQRRVRLERRRAAGLGADAGRGARAANESGQRGDPGQRHADRGHRPGRGSLAVEAKGGGHRSLCRRDCTGRSTHQEPSDPVHPPPAASGQATRASPSRRARLRRRPAQKPFSAAWRRSWRRPSGREQLWCSVRCTRTARTKRCTTVRSPAWLKRCVAGGGPSSTFSRRSTTALAGGRRRCRPTRRTQTARGTAACLRTAARGGHGASGRRHITLCALFILGDEASLGGAAASSCQRGAKLEAAVEGVHRETPGCPHRVRPSLPLSRGLRGGRLRPQEQDLPISPPSTPGCPHLRCDEQSGSDWTQARSGWARDRR